MRGRLLCALGFTILSLSLFAQGNNTTGGLTEARANKLYSKLDGSNWGTNVFKLPPFSTNPTITGEGKLIWNSTTKKIMVFDGTSWYELGAPPDLSTYVPYKDAAYDLNLGDKALKQGLNWTLSGTGGLDPTYYIKYNGVTAFSMSDTGGADFAGVVGALDFVSRTSSTINTTGKKTALGVSDLQASDISYVWPSAQGSASTVLTNDGSGNLTWGAAGGVTLPTNATGWLYNNGSGTLAWSAPDLSGVVPYTGAVGTVDLGSHGIAVGSSISVNARYGHSNDDPSAYDGAGVDPTVDSDGHVGSTGRRWHIISAETLFGITHIADTPVLDLIDDSDGRRHVTFIGGGIYQNHTDHGTAVQTFGVDPDGTVTSDGGFIGDLTGTASGNLTAESDTLSTVTGRGASTPNPISVSGGTTSALTDFLINPTTKASGSLIDAQIGNVSKFSVDNLGAVNALSYNSTNGVHYFNLKTSAFTESFTIGNTAWECYSEIGSNFITTSRLTLSKSDSTDINDLFINPTAKSSGNLIAAQINGASKFKVDYLGGITANSITAGAGGSNFTGTFTQGNSWVAAILNAANFTSTFANTGTGQSISNIKVITTYNQPTATSIANTDLLLNRTETSLGTTPGAQYLIDAQVAGTSKFNVTNAGVVNTASIITSGNNTFNSASLNWPVSGIIYAGAASASAAGLGLAVQQYPASRTNTTGQNYTFRIIPTYNQASGDGANTDLLINRTQTAVGSGEQNLIDAQVSGTSKFKVTNTGAVNCLGLSQGSGAVNYAYSYDMRPLGSSYTYAFAVTPQTAFAATSGLVTPYKLTATYNHASGTSVANTDLLIQRTETSLGTTPGTQNLIDAQVGGVSKFAVTNAGVVSATTFSATGGLSAINSLTVPAIASGGVATVELKGRTTNNIPGDIVDLATRTLTNTTGTVYPVSILPTYNQSTATGVINTDLRINRVETSLGTTPGAQLLIDAQVSGVSKFSVDNTGVITAPTLVGAVTGTASGNIPVIASVAQGDIMYYSGSAWVRLPAGTAGQHLKTGGASANPSWVSDTRSVAYVIDGGGSAITTGSKGFIVVDMACTITGVTVLADASGSCVVDIKKSTYSGFPTTASICASAKPTLSSVQKNQDTTLTGWTTAIAAGDVLEYNVDSASTVKRVVIDLKVTVP